MAWREYHEFTKHSVESLRRTRQYLDWANMPDPFRHYEGVPILDLPADPPMPQARAIDVLRGGAGSTLANNGAEFLSQLMFYSASIKALPNASRQPEASTRCVSIPLPAICIRPNFTSARGAFWSGQTVSIIIVPRPTWQNSGASEILPEN